MRALGIIGAAIVLLAGLAGFWGWNAYTRPGPLAEPLPLVIPRGGTEEVSIVLRENQVIGDPRLFAAAAWITSAQGPLRAAELVFPAHVSLREALLILREARPVRRRLTIAEGLTARQIAALIERTPGLTGEVPPLAEGAMLPETYTWSWGDTRASVVRRGVTAMEQALAEAWASRAENLPLANPRDALILASIIERETGLSSERGLVGGVFINRLRRGMMLQSDPTVAYGPGQGLPLDRPLTRADLEQAHPFNTYRIRGLPPAPIASPGREALKAATQPEATEFLYFVANGSGGHAFAATLEEHNRNVARWRALGTRSP
ncbi:MAG: aminodeoxychorismate lyase [Rubritepida sp.]|nr:aminodeoxychorismate lyase [Rubritepida sp.]